MSENPKRWSLPRYTLRTLFVVVTVLAIGLGWIARQQNIVEERAEMIKQIGRMESNKHDTTYLLLGCVESEWMDQVRNDIPWAWRLLGTQAIWTIVLDSEEYTEADVERLAKLFPESCIHLRSSGDDVVSIIPLRWQ